MHFSANVNAMSCIRKATLPCRRMTLREHSAPPELARRCLLDTAMPILETACTL